MAELEVQIDGVELLRRKAQDATIVGPVRKALEEALLLLQAQVQEFCPVDTGRLRASFTHDIEAHPIPYFGRVFTSVKYAAFVEYGKGHPRGVGQIPYARPALAEKEKDIKGKFDQAAAEIDREWRR